jgi:hypothetical protein
MRKFNWKTRSATITIFILLILVTNPEVRAFLLLSELMGTEVIFMVLIAQLKIYWPMIKHYIKPLLKIIQKPLIQLFTGLLLYTEVFVPIKITKPLIKIFYRRPFLELIHPI